MNPESVLRQSGIELPPPPEPGGNYLPCRQHRDTLYLAGVISVQPNGPSWFGQVGAERSLDDGYAAARLCALNALATIRAHLGTLERVEQFLYLGGYVNAAAGYGKSPTVVNGASDLLERLYGERGRHARAAVAVAGLPRNAAVEIQLVIQIREA